MPSVQWEGRQVIPTSCEVLTPVLILDNLRAWIRDYLHLSRCICTQESLLRVFLHNRNRAHLLLVSAPHSQSVAPFAGLGSRWKPDDYHEAFRWGCGWSHLVGQYMCPFCPNSTLDPLGGSDLPPARCKNIHYCHHVDLSIHQIHPAILGELC